MSLIEETVYRGRDNPIALILKNNDANLSTTEMSAITRMDIRYNGTYYSSASSPTLFDWTTFNEDAKVIIKLGMCGLTTGSDANTELIVYDAANTNGLMWDVFKLTVTDDAAPD